MRGREEEELRVGLFIVDDTAVLYRVYECGNDDGKGCKTDE